MVSVIKSVYLFPNEMICVCDKNGEQIPEFQGRFSIERMKQILDNSDENTEFRFNCEIEND